MTAVTACDGVVLDVMLPGIGCFETCRRLRRDGIRTPILMLTARDAVEDRITGLDTGADDCLATPFDFGEVLARARAARPGRAWSGAARRRPAARSGQPPRAPRRRRGPAVDQGVPKLDRPFGVEMIEMVRCAGYRMKGV
jgi:DNA-binding response OmpR family regulator